jgi:pimeloyl-ACP methyl ester carboxylesterase
VWPGDTQRRLLLAHATGFCKEVWSPVVAGLRSLGYDGEVVAWDFTAHGDSPAGSPPYDWWAFAAEVLAVVDAFDGQMFVGVGHSMGAASLAMAEVERPGTFDRLILIEPIIFPPPFVRADHPLVFGALRRRARFESIEEARANFASKPVFSAWSPEALDAYASGGLEVVDGGARLKCRPENEADIYRGGSAHGVFDRLGEVRVPVFLVAGEQSTTHGPALMELLAAQLDEAAMEYVAHAGHFVPMERPDVVARLIASLV